MKSLKALFSLGFSMRRILNQAAWIELDGAIAHKAIIFLKDLISIDKALIMTSL